MSVSDEERGLARYRVFLAIPYTRSLIGWSLVARMPIAMTPLALLLLAREHGATYAAAGAVVAAYGLALAVGSLVAGRRVDRRGPSGVLLSRAVAFPTLLVVVIVLAAVDAPTYLLGLAAAAVGAASPPVSSTVRMVWPRILPDTLRSTAYSLEAVAQETIFVIGPLLTALLALIDPALALGVTAAAALVGTLAVAWLPPVREAGSGVASGGGLLGALEAPGMRTLVVYSLIIGLSFGAIEVTMPAFAEGHGARELGGLALAAFSAGSLVGGIVAGALPGGDDRARFLRYACLLGLSLAVFEVAWSIPSLCAAAFIAGLPIAPAVAALYGLVDRVAPKWAIAESFAWFGTAIMFGLSIGTAVGGAVVDGAGTRWSLAIGPAAALVAAGFVVLRRATLVRVETAT